jgi:hypothetical protein
MRFIGIDLHTNRFTCCYRDESAAGKEIVSFTLDAAGIARFLWTVKEDPYVPVEATITTFAFVPPVRERVKTVVAAAPTA